MLNSLAKSHLNSVCTEYVCDKSENARVCAKCQWNALDWCYWIALPASPVLQSSNTVSCVSLSFRAHPCVLAINNDADHIQGMHRVILKYSHVWRTELVCIAEQSEFLQWHSSLGQFQLSFSCGVPVYPANTRWVTQLYPSVHWVNQWHSRGIPMYTGPASVHWLRVMAMVPY